MPKGKNYQVKIRIKNHDLPKSRVSDKTINFDFPRVSKITKISCLELSTVIRERERERERARETVRDRERQRQRETETETERDRERQRQTETDRKRDRETETHRER